VRAGKLQNELAQLPQIERVNLFCRERSALGAAFLRYAGPVPTVDFGARHCTKTVSSQQLVSNDSKFQVCQMGQYWIPLGATMPIAKTVCSGRTPSPKEKAVSNNAEGTTHANPETDVNAAVPGPATITLTGTVDKIFPAIGELQPEKAQIAVEGAEPLYREIRIDNSLQDGAGNAVSPEVGAEVEVTIEAKPKA
jgi:hypothetical protein